ncbi:MAG: nuclear transport factor 2 family protein [Bacteroidota bacterium]
MTRFTIFLFLLLSFFSLSAQNMAPADEQAIREVMKAQEIAWTNGDIDAFMEGYWKSEDLIFVGSSGVNHGWQATLDRYKKTYPDKAAMGKLTFELLKVEGLGPETAFVLGKWHLDREKDELGGYFTLIWKKVEGKWVIVSDHSS